MTDALNDVRSVRPGEQLDWARVVEWLREHVTAHQIPQLDLTRTFEVAQFPGGHSNLTYLLRFSDVDIVVRRPPLGPVARRAVSAAVVDTLADLHAIDVAANGLSGLGKPAGFVERQVRGWSDRWQRAQTSPLPQMDALAQWLREHLPGDPATPSVVHGDFKLDNVMLDPRDIGRIVAVLDWEMSALGDPLVDLGILLAYWVPTAPPLERDALTTVTHRPGYFTRDEILDRYAQRSGRDLSNIRFYQIFAIFKITVVIQQIYFRYVSGQTTDARFATFDERVAYLVAQASTLAQP